MSARGVPLELNSRVLPLLLNRLRSQTGSIRHLIDRFDLPENAEQCAQIRILLPRFRELTEIIADELRDPFLGIHLAQSLPRGAYGLLEFAIRTGSSPRAAFADLARYGKLIHNLGEYSMEERRQEAIIEYQIPGEPQGGGRHSNEFSIASILRMGWLLTAHKYAARRVWFTHPRPDNTSQLETFFETERITFNARTNGMTIPSSKLDLPLVTSDPELYALLSEQARKELATFPEAGDFAAQVRQKIRTALHHGAPTLEGVADLLHLSPRTLQRRLLEAETSWGVVRDDALRSLAQVYLDDDHLELGEIAFLLRYSDTRSFGRAFKQWTGQTATKYRQRGMK